MKQAVKKIFEKVKKHLAASAAKNMLFWPLLILKTKNNAIFTFRPKSENVVPSKLKV